MRYPEEIGQLTDQIRKTFYKLMRQKKITTLEMSKFLADMSIQMYQDYCDYSKESTVKIDEDISSKISEESQQDYKKMWYGIVQQFIDFINNHDDVKSALQYTQDKYREDVEGKDLFLPDIRFIVSADGLESSIADREWVPATDSYTSISVGIKPIIEMM